MKKYPPEQWIAPAIEKIVNGDITWRKRENRNYNFIGRILTCHLAIEYYIENYIKIEYPRLDIEGARLSFSSKLNLIGKDFFAPSFDIRPGIVELNALRNKLSHNIEHEIGDKDILEIRKLLLKMDKVEKSLISSPETAIDIFTSVCCSYFAATITHAARAKGTTLI